jgi:ribonuclease E
MRARLSAGEAALFDRHDVASTIAVASERDVTLPNGGRISVEPTRALTAMDVDSGAGSGVANARLATNLEAAKEIARQLWLRDLGGMIVVDFIRMDEAGERRRVQDALAAAVASDRVPVHLLGWSRAGLFELIRERGRGGGA